MKENYRKLKTFTIFIWTAFSIDNLMFNIYLQNWPSDALLAVAKNLLNLIDLTEHERSVCINMCQKFHSSIQDLTIEFEVRLQRKTYVTPTSYLELISTFKNLLGKKRQ